jgi:plastocyanin
VTTVRRSHRTRSITAAVACALFLAACGGDDAGETDTSATAATEDAASDVDPDETLDAPEEPEPDAAEDPGASETRVELLDDDGFVFSPADVEIAAGETVTWVHEGRISHSVTAGDDTFDSGTMAAGDVFEFTFDEPGEYPYVCIFHGNMRGTVTVS